jgi:hypothetical protein
MEQKISPLTANLGACSELKSMHYNICCGSNIYTDGGYVFEVQIGDFVVVKGSICFSVALGTKLIQIK